MAPRVTRSKAKTPIVKAMVKNEEEALAKVSNVAQKNPLQPPSSNPPKLFVLPKDTSPEAKIVTLSHPRYAQPTRYFVCPKKGFYEFKKIAPPKGTPRSWLLTPSEKQSQAEGKGDEGKDNEYTPSKGYVKSDAALFIATTIDPLFLVLPALSAQCNEEKQRFLEADEYFDLLISKASHYRPLLANPSLRNMLESRMAGVSDTVDAGDETMYRLNLDKLLQVLTQKCRAMVGKGLPKSLEEVKIRKTLEKPLASKLRDLVEDKEALPTPKTDTESQPSLRTEDSVMTDGSFSEAPTGVTTTDEKEGVVEPIDAPEKIVEALRMQTAYTFIIASYIPATLASLLDTKLTTLPLTPHMAALSTHLVELKELREKAALSRSLGDFSHKREYNEEGEARAEKKRKLEEEEKLKKKNMSQGVKKLMKVDTKGMKKMSDFFKKNA